MGWSIKTDDKGIKIKAKSGVSKATNKPYTLYSTGVSTKKQDGSWATAWIDVRFKKSVLEEKPFFNNAIINIKSAFPMANEYNDKTSLVIFIMDYDVIEKGEEPQPENVTPSNDFVQIAANEVDLPFS